MIKNIVFDVGEVLLGYRWQEMFAEYGLSEEDANRVGNAIFHNGVWEKLDEGTVTMEEAKAIYREQMPEFKDAIEWFLSHTELMRVERPEVWSYFPKLKERGYHLYLLSNYSREVFEVHTRGASFLSEVEGGIISYQINQIKPNPEIYRALFEKYELNPAECLFFDDRQENVEGSIAVGMQAVRVTSKEQLIGELEKLLKS